MDKQIISFEGNPVLDAWANNIGKSYLDKSYADKWDITRQYTFAIPNEEAIQALVELSPIIEMGAGTGYWAKLIHDAGGDIVAYDSRPTIKKNFNHYFYIHHLYYDVKFGSVERLIHYPNHTLLLCWPNYNTFFAFNCLNKFKGNKVVYIGEGKGGCTGDNKFHDMLESDFNKIECINIPQWNYLHDRMWIYERK